jgi:subtilisin family serine protease
MSVSDPDEDRRKLLEQSTLSDAFLDRSQREKLELPEDEHEPFPVVVELNLLHASGLKGAQKRFEEFYDQLTKRPAAMPVANTYLACQLSLPEIRGLITRDQEDTPLNERAIYRIWPDFPVRAQIDRSVATVKGDAARRSYEATGEEVIWAVIDSGIDDRHPHFDAYDTLRGDVETLHRDFTGGGTDSPGESLTDPYGHGTHVAGIIAGGLMTGATPLVAQKVANDGTSGRRFERREVKNSERLTGVAPRCKLVSLKVLNEKGKSLSTDVLRALQYVREEVNGQGKLLRIQGVNLSLGYEFDAQWFACGQSPLCVEVDRLVQSGVVVVTAAGNTGYGTQAAGVGRTNTGLTLTINDPGNAALAITVGATHRDSPHTYGVSYFSSKGPTGDGRLKPDLVAPGERITSCAAGKWLDQVTDLWMREVGEDGGPCPAAYIDDSGTSMAAPHVSGAIAAFLSIRREFIGRPTDVKRIFMENATSLGRERYFEGSGMVDLMRAIQAV